MKSAPLVLLFAVCVAEPAFGVMRLDGGPRQTAAPTGDLADAGWQYEGQYAGFLGTAVGPHHFLTAQHIGGGVGQAFTYGGQNYATTAFTNVPGTDLRLWTVGGTLPSFAPLYDAAVDGSEIGRRMFVVGRGTQRGAPIYLADRPVDAAYPGASAVRSAGEFVDRTLVPVSDRFYAAQPPTVPTPAGTAATGGTFAPSRLVGWRWGPEDRVQSWGTNTVADVVDGGPRLGRVLAFAFDPAGGEAAAGLSAGDSGGGVFLDVDGTWKLAGINYGVDGPFRFDPASAAFNASIFDARGLYLDGQTPVYLDGPSVLAGSSYASSVSANLGFIGGALGTVGTVPEPAAGVIVLMAGALLTRSRRLRLRKENGV